MREIDEITIETGGVMAYFPNSDSGVMLAATGAGNRRSEDGD